jgi:hypothetical protein
MSQQVSRDCGRQYQNLETKMMTRFLNWLEQRPVGLERSGMGQS